MWALVVVVVAVLSGAAAMVPAVIVEFAEDRGGIGEVDTFDFVIVSAVIAAGVAAVATVAANRARNAGQAASDVITAAFDGAVATASTGVLGLVGYLLVHVREEEAIGEGVGVELATWSAVQLAAAGIGYLTNRAVSRWVTRSPAAVDHEHGATVTR